MVIRGGLRRRLLPVAKRNAEGTAYPNKTDALNTPVQGTGADGLKAAVALLWEPPTQFPPLRALGAMAELGILGTAVAYLLYFWLIRHVGATRTSLVTYLLPCTALVYGAISGEPWHALQPIGARNLRLAIPQTRVFEELSPAVARAFERASRRLSTAGVGLIDAKFDYFAEIEARNGCGVIEYVDALAWHRELLARRGADYDPNVRARVEKGATIAAWEYAAMQEWRKDIIARFDRDTCPFDAIILPTVAITAPTIDECERDESNVRSKLLRNPSLFNFLDRPAITIPIHPPGEAPVGLMVAGERDQDWRLLAIARAFEAVLAN